MESTVEQIKKYVQEHLHQQITLNDIAKQIGYSKYHVSRVFKDETGAALFEYIRKERLLAAAHALRNTDKKVLDIAFDFMFDSHEGFTRSFSNCFGINPKRFSDYPEPSGWLIPYFYLDRHKNNKSEDISMESKATVIFTQIVERPAPWDILCGIKEALNEPMGVWLPDSMCPEGTGIYAHAVEVPVDYSGDIPEGFDVIDLEPCKYLIFQGEPYDEEQSDVGIGAVWGHIRSFNPKVYGYEWDDEIAPRFQFAPMGWRGYIEGRPVKKMN